MAAHTYWRLNITANQSGDPAYPTMVSISEIAFKESVGGSDTTSGGTPTASTYANGSNIPAYAFDDLTGTNWTTGLGVALPHYIAYQHTAPVDIVEYTVRTSAIAGQQVYAPKSWTLEWSDNGSTWTAIHSVTDEPTWTYDEARTYNAVSYTLAGNVTEGSYSYISKWLVKLWKTYSAATYQEQVLTGLTYSFILSSEEPYVIACAPYIDGKWEANKAVTLGQFYVASNPETSAHLWEVTTAGTFGATEATWNLSGTTTQGTATMTYVGALPNPSILGPKIPS